MRDDVVAACVRGDAAAVQDLLDDGVGVNRLGFQQGFKHVPPLHAAVSRQHLSVVTLLLSRGADPNGPEVMSAGAYGASARILQLLVDAGGDLHRRSSGWPPVFAALSVFSPGNCGQKVQVFLSQPRFRMSDGYDGMTLQEYACAKGRPVVAEMIAAEVSVGSR